MKLQISLSAIPLSIVKKMMRKTPSKANHMYDEIFTKLGEGKSVDKSRIYIPLDDAAIIPHKVTAPQEIVEYLASIKFSLNDYLLGTAMMPDGKRTVRLGKALSKRPDLLRKFENDPQRKLVRHDKMWVVISRHPYDILGMSFDRGWTSCMNLEDGINKHYLKGDLKQGTLVAYLIKDTDKNINAPISRIAIRPYYEKKSIRKTKKNIYLVPSGVYGTSSEKFETIVKKFCALINDHAPHGHYVLKNDLYDDGEGSDIFHVNASTVKTLSDEDCLSLCQQPRLESDVIEELLKRKNSKVTQELIAVYPHLIREESLLAIANDSSMRDSHRILTYSQKKLSLNVLLALTKSVDKVTLKNLATKTTRVEILKVLMNSSNPDVRCAVAYNSVTPEDMLLKLSDDEDHEVVSSVLEAENVNVNTLKRILARTGLEPYQIARWKKIVVSRTDLPSDFVLSLIRENLEKPFLYTQITERHDLPVDVIRTIYEKTVAHVDNEVYSDTVMQNLCKCKNTPLDILEKLAVSEYNVASALIRRSDLPSEISDRLLARNPNNYKVISNILDRPEVTEEQMKLIVTCNNGDAVEDAVRSGHMDKEIAKYFVENGVDVFLRNEARHVASEHPLSFAIARYSKDEKVLRNLVDYNNAALLDTTYMELLKNPVTPNSLNLLYALYFRADKKLYESVREFFAPYLKSIDDYAKEQYRYTVAEIDEIRNKAAV